jgi:hypothetical protein
MNPPKIRRSMVPTDLFSSTSIEAIGPTFPSWTAILAGQQTSLTPSRFPPMSNSRPARSWD